MYGMKAELRTENVYQDRFSPMSHSLQKNWTN